LVNDYGGYGANLVNLISGIAIALFQNRKEIIDILYGMGFDGRTIF